MSLSRFSSSIRALETQCLKFIVKWLGLQRDQTTLLGTSESTFLRRESNQTSKGLSRIHVKSLTWFSGKPDTSKPINLGDEYRFLAGYRLQEDNYQKNQDRSYVQKNWPPS